MTAAVAAVCLLACPGLSFAADAGTRDGTQYYEAATGLFGKGDYPGAVIQLKNALQKSPDLLAAHVLLGRAYLKQHLGAEAEKEIKLAMQAGGDNSVTAPLLAEAYLLQFQYRPLLDEVSAEGLGDAAAVEVLVMRGQAHLEIGELEPANQDFKEAARRDPTGVRPVLGQALTALRRSDFATAASLADEALKRAPQDPEAWNTRASVHHAKGELAEALAKYTKALELEPLHRDARVARVAVLLDLGRDAETREDFAYLGEHYASDPRAAYLRALKLARAGDDAGARSHLAEAANLLSQVDTDWLDNNAQLLLLAGTTNFSLGDFEKAQGYLERYVAHNANATGARKLLAASLLATDKADRAISILTTAQIEAPRDPKVLSLLANAWMAKGRHEKATQLLEQAAALPGADSDVQTELAITRLLGGKTEQALGDLQSIVKTHPEAGKANLVLAVMYQRRGEFKQAAELAGRLCEQNPKNLTALNLLASAQAGLGDRAAARETYRRALDVDPAFHPAVLNLAKLDLLDGKPGDARERLKEALKHKANDDLILMALAETEERDGKPAEAIRWLEQGRSANGGAVNLRLYLANLLIRDKALDRAQTVVEEAQSRDPESLQVLEAAARLQIALDHPQQARGILKRMADRAAFDAPALVGIAQRQAQIQATDDALYSLSKAVQGAPDYRPARVAALQVALAAGNSGRVDSELEALAARWPDDPVTLQLTGDVAMSRNQPAQAASAYRKALDRQPSSLFTIRLAAALMASRQGNDAAATLRRWVDAHPDDAAARQALAEAEFFLGNLPAALKAYEAAVARDPKNATLLNNYAVVLEKSGDAGALARAREARALAPADPNVNDTLGWLLTLHDQAEEGLTYLRDAQSRDASSPSIRYHLALALAGLDRKDEAKRELDTLLADKSEFGDRGEAEALRRRLGP
jgi:putative PEP-CTERM system TPR-repeat lipoprotein